MISDPTFERAQGYYYVPYRELMAFIGIHKYIVHILPGLDSTFPLCELWFLAEQE